MQSLVEALEQAPQTPRDGLSILPKSERHRSSICSPRPQEPIRKEKVIHELFEGQRVGSRTKEVRGVGCGCCVEGEH